MKVKFFAVLFLLLVSSCAIDQDGNKINPFYDQSYCNSTLVDSDDYCRDRLYPKHKQPPVVIKEPKDDSEDTSTEQPKDRSENNNISQPRGEKGQGSRDHGTSSRRGRGD